MKKNMGLVDRILRALLAATLLGLYLGNIITGIWGIIACIVAVVFALTSWVSFCPLYLPFGINTNHQKK